MENPKTTLEALENLRKCFIELGKEVDKNLLILDKLNVSLKVLDDTLKELEEWKQHLAGK